MHRGKRDRSPQRHRAGGNWNRGSRPAPFLERPPTHYRCVVCDQGTHWAIECPSYRDAPWLYPNLSVNSECFSCLQKDARHGKNGCPHNDSVRTQCTSCYGIHKSERCPYAKDQVCNWIEVFNTNNHKCFFYDKKSKESSWLEPQSRDTLRWLCEPCNMLVVHERKESIEKEVTGAVEASSKTQTATEGVEENAEVSSVTASVPTVATSASSSSSSSSSSSGSSVPTDTEQGKIAETSAEKKVWRVVKNCPKCGFLRPRYAGDDEPLTAYATLAGEEARVKEENQLRPDTKKQQDGGQEGNQGEGRSAASSATSNKSFVSHSIASVLTTAPGEEQL